MFKAVKDKILVSHLVVASVVATVVGLSSYYTFMHDYILPILAGIFLLVVSGARILSSNITRPLIRLADASNQVARGKLSKIKKTIAKDKEIIDLIESFNKMTESLSSVLISKDYVENVFQSINDSIAIVDEEGRIKSVNTATIELLERPKDELIGRNAGILFGEDAGEGDIRKIRYQLKHNTGMESLVSSYETKSGRQIPVIISGSLLTDREGTGYDLVVVGKDITERKRQEEELQSIVVKLEESNNELQDFAHIASHDLQEPLRKIMAFGERLNSKYADKLDDQGRDYLNRMRNASVRMQSLIQSLLMYSRVTTKARPFEPVDLTKVIDGVLTDLEVRVQETGGQVQTGDLPVINADPLQMRQLFQNLIGNALKFNKADEPPFVHIFCGPDDGGVQENGSAGKALHEIIVQDNGIGFDGQYTDRIFGVFQRLHGRNEYEGSGIGLSICRKIVTRHGGNIRAESSPGHGARFIITLPAADEPEEDIKHADMEAVYE